MSYSTPAEFKQRYDLRLLGDLVADDGTQVSSAGLDADAVLQTCLDDAQGAIQAALLRGKLYSTDDLSHLTAPSSNYLKRMECDIALRYLYDRRVYSKPSEELDKIEDRAQKHLKALQNGESIFDVARNSPAQTVQTTGPTTVQLENLYSVRRRTQHYFPQTPMPGNR